MYGLSVDRRTHSGDAGINGTHVTIETNIDNAEATENMPAAAR